MHPARITPTAAVPVMAQVDVFIYGAGLAAPAAAVAAEQAGLRTFTVSDRSYFGEDLAGALELWPEGTPDPVLLDLLGPLPPVASAAAGKHAVDCAMLQAGATFRFHLRPIALLRTVSGRFGGVVLAHRTSLFAIRAGALIDVSRHQTLARLAGAPTAPVVPARSPRLVALAPEMPEDWSRRCRLLAHIASTPTPDKNHPIPDLDVWRLDLGTAPVPQDHAAAAAWEWERRNTVLDRRIVTTAGSLMPFVSWWPCATTKWEREGLHPLPPLAPEAGSSKAWQMAADHVRRARELVADLEIRSEPLHVPATSPHSDGQASVTLDFAPTFLRGPRELVQVPLEGLDDFGEVDVVVAGGGTGGACAGISAAQAGARTVVLETQHGLGGVGTIGQISGYYWGNKVGFTAEISRGLHALDPSTRWSRGNSWNPELKMAYLSRTLAEAGGTAWLGSFACGVQMEGSTLTGVVVSTPFGAGLLRCGTAVDSTGSADLASAAGAPCRVIDGRHAAVQGTGLSPYTPGIPARNSDHTFIDDNDPDNVTHAFVEAHAKFKGQFDVGTIVASRERRQILGEIELSPVDFLAGRTYPDTITTARSNFDTHGFTIHPLFLIRPPDKKEMRAHVPFRCLLPQGVEGLLVTGLGISAHRDALPVVRMQADVQNQGFAAGLAAARAALGHFPVRQISLRELQSTLIERGILAPEVGQQEDSFPLAPEVVREAVLQADTSLTSVSILLSHRSLSEPLVRTLFAAPETTPSLRETLALVLGFWGDPSAGEFLLGQVRDADWDEGWNYRGMFQFGQSFSRMDSLIVALAKTRHRGAVGMILAKAEALALDPSPAFSHCRALAIAAGVLEARELAPALARLLNLPGIRGHAQLHVGDLIPQSTDAMIDDQPRQLSLRELFLARGLYFCGDADGLGRSILETYARDQRGLFARHAGAILHSLNLDHLKEQAC